MFTPEVGISVLLFICATLAYYKRKLTFYGSVLAYFVGLFVYIGLGWPALVLLIAFFMLGTLATGCRKSAKSTFTKDIEHNGRTAGQVLANGGVAAIVGLLAWYQPDYRNVCLLMAAGSLASATADTLSSELGTVYGKRFFNILTLKPDTRGLDGVISIEGTVIGIAGATVIAIIYGLFSGWSVAAGYIILAGFIGNLADSILGATLERKGVLSNNAVNLVNTTIGALVCWVLT